MNVVTATEIHISGIFSLIQELALYEKAPEQVTITKDELKRDLKNNSFECFVALDNNNVVGMAFYYYKYSTWKGRCLYLEDLVVTESYRRTGVGAKLFEAVIAKSKAEGVERMEWQVLDWNTPAINFYKKYNADLDEEWINGRFMKNQLDKFTFAPINN